jgi:hypothetical protein
MEGAVAATNQEVPAGRQEGLGLGAGGTRAGLLGGAVQLGEAGHAVMWH